MGHEDSVWRLEVDWWCKRLSEISWAQSMMMIWPIRHLWQHPTRDNRPTENAAKNSIHQRRNSTKSSFVSESYKRKADWLTTQQNLQPPPEELNQTSICDKTYTRATTQRNIIPSPEELSQTVICDILEQLNLLPPQDGIQWIFIFIPEKIDSVKSKLEGIMAPIIQLTVGSI